VEGESQSEIRNLFRMQGQSGIARHLRLRRQKTAFLKTDHRSLHLRLTIIGEEGGGRMAMSCGAGSSSNAVNCIAPAKPR
jgi:hypothetical protein